MITHHSRITIISRVTGNPVISGVYVIENAANKIRALTELGRIVDELIASSGGSEKCRLLEATLTDGNAI